MAVLGNPAAVGNQRLRSREVGISASKWGFILRTGQWAIPPKCDGAYSFSDGLAIVKMGEPRNIDKTGRYMKNL